MNEPRRDVRPHVQLTREQVLAFIENPLKQLPDEWRLPVWDFWAFFENLLPTQIALCTRIRRWRDHEGLTFDELQEAMDDLRAPDLAATFQFAGQVLAGLADRIEANRKSRRERERAEAEARKKQAVPANLCASNLGPSWRGEVVPLFTPKE